MEVEKYGGRIIPYQVTTIFMKHKDNDVIMRMSSAGSTPFEHLETKLFDLDMRSLLNSDANTMQVI